MTEDEAKTKWCPFARHEATAGNRLPYGKPGDEPAPDDYCAEAAMLLPCIGSACMAWQWKRKPGVKGHCETVPHPGNGFCGLAGASQ